MASKSLTKRDIALLLFQDDAPFRQCLDRVTQQLELSVQLIRAEHPGAAIESLLLQPTELLLLQLGGAKRFGLELLAKMRNHPELRRIPVVLLAPPGVERTEILGAYDQGAVTVLVVPPEACEEVLKEALAYWSVHVCLPKPAGGADCPA